ncbi:MAG: hypothetical protein ACYCPS_02170 [Candidatus Saccharimonadales bacterium]
MAAIINSPKRTQIEKSMSKMVLAASIAVFLLIFSVASSRELIHKMSFQNKVIAAKTTARNQLQQDVSAASKLTSAYESFNSAKTNLLGNQVTGVDNDNAKIVLDALPSTYDYPALVSSLQALLSNQGVTIDSIGGSDQSATLGNGSSSGGNSTPVAMPFTFSVDGPYQNIQNVINTFEKSIRPFQFQTISLSGNQSDVTLSVTAQTFFQPAKTFNITTETIQ